MSLLPPPISVAGLNLTLDCGKVEVDSVGEAGGPPEGSNGCLAPSTVLAGSIYCVNKNFINVL